MSMPAPNPDPIDALLREIAALPVARDPLAEWMAAHVEELRPYAGQQAAIDPVRDLCIIRPTLDELIDELFARGLDQDHELTITPIL